MAKVKDFFLNKSNFKVKVTRSKFLVPMERSSHKELTYEISASSGWEAMAKVKFFFNKKKVKLQRQGH